MNKMDVLAVIITVLWNLVCIGLLQREWKKSEDNLNKSKKGLIYATVMIICNVTLILILREVYVERSLLFLLKRMGILAILWMIAPFDYKYHRIPNVFLLAGVIYRAIILLGEVIVEHDNLLSTLMSEGIAMLAVTIIAFLCMLIIKDSIGAGDVKLMLLMAFCQGTVGVGSAIFCSMIVSFFVAVFLLATKRKERKDAIPFGPCILLGTFISVFLIGA